MGLIKYLNVRGVIKGIREYSSAKRQYTRTLLHNIVVRRDLAGTEYEGTNPFVNQDPDKPTLLNFLKDAL